MIKMKTFSMKREKAFTGRPEKSVQKILKKLQKSVDNGITV